MTENSSARPRSSRSQILGRWLREAATLAAVCVVLLSARSSLADHYHVPSGSMEPTVHIGDRVIVKKAAYGWRLPGTSLWLSDITMPERGDVVVFRSPEDGTVLIKRVVATAGDSVAVRGGVLWLNGRRTADAGHNRETTEDIGRAHTIRLDGHGGPPLSPRTVPEGTMLVLGDNRGHSHDGRFFGWVKIESLLGQAHSVYWRDGAPTWLEL